MLAAGVALLSGACSPKPAGRTSPLPELPQLITGKFQPAIRDQVEKARAEAQANPNDAAANGKLGMVLQAYEQYRAAEACYQRARALEPGEFRWVYYLGTVQAAMGKNARAAETLREALRLDAEYLPARMKLAEVLLGLGELRESREIYEKVARKYPDFAQAHYGLGRLRSAQGEFAPAVEHYRRACELAPHFGAAHYALALAYQKLGESARAQEHIALYQKHQTSAPPAQDTLLDAVKALNAGALHHLKKGLGLEAAGQMELAIAEHERALEINPNLVQAHVNLVTLYGKLGRAEQAEKHYRATVELNPNLSESHYNFGVFLHSQGRYRDAAAAFGKALEISPDYAEAHNNLAYILEREGRLEEAIEHYRAAIANKPNYRLAHFHLGRLLLHKSRNAEAIRHFLQTLTPQDESTPGYMYGLGAAYARSGNRQSALHYIREARARAASLGQTQLLASIERDLRILEQAGGR